MHFISLGEVQTAGCSVHIVVDWVCKNFDVRQDIVEIVRLLQERLQQGHFSPVELSRSGALVTGRNDHRNASATNTEGFFVNDLTGSDDDGERGLSCEHYSSASRKRPGTELVPEDETSSRKKPRKLPPGLETDDVDKLEEHGQDYYDALDEADQSNVAKALDKLMSRELKPPDTTYDELWTTGVDAFVNEGSDPASRWRSLIRADQLGGIRRGAGKVLVALLFHWECDREGDIPAGTESDVDLARDAVELRTRGAKCMNTARFLGLGGVLRLHHKDLTLYV